MLLPFMEALARRLMLAADPAVTVPPTFPPPPELYFANDVALSEGNSGFTDLSLISASRRPTTVPVTGDYYTNERHGTYQ